ncbi:MAG TPA: FadR/GntR family transcriptional regulator [Gaiellaceae bacterium]|nr:FadR/GntR family transcriptional regulator [Gaiellaceae bacterium]
MASTQMYPRRGLHGQIVHRIGMQIMSGELKPGDALPADELSAELGLSRTVLREVVKVLAAKGLVEAKPKTGTRVRPRSAWNLLDPDVLAWRSEANPDGAFFRNIVELRRIIEPEAARLAAERASAGEIASIEAVFSEMEALVDDPDAYLEPDLRFHELILEACHNELLAHMVGIMRAVFRALFVATFPRSTRTSRRATDLHGEIVRALVARDGLAAEKAMRTLIEDTAKRLPTS